MGRTDHYRSYLLHSRCNHYCLHQATEVGGCWGRKQREWGADGVSGKLHNYSEHAGPRRVKIGETLLFGLRINRKHWFGLPVMRETATRCMANLYDDKGNHIAPLWWRSSGGVGEPKITVDLDSGQEADLLLFAQRNDDRPNYYPYRKTPSGDPAVPVVKLNGERRVIVRVNCFDGQKKSDFRYRVTTDYEEGTIDIWPKWRKRHILQ